MFGQDCFIIQELPTINNIARGVGKRLSQRSGGEPLGVPQFVISQIFW